MTLLTRKKITRSLLVSIALFLPFCAIGYHWLIFRKLRCDNIRKYSARDNRLVSSAFAWKGPIRRETQDFSGKKRRKEKYGGLPCAERVTGGSNLSHLENAIMLAYWPDRTQFFTVHPPLGIP